MDTMSAPGSRTFTSYCPTGPRWRTLSNGQIEVEGLGVPMADSGGYHADGAVVGSVWAQWKQPILDAAAATGIPARWILALIIIESRGKNWGMNSAGAGGLMGLMVAAASRGLGRQASEADVADPATNIRAGAGFMRYNAGLFGMELPILADAHNAGSPKCSTETRCKATIDGSWTFDGTIAPNSMGMVEDCTAGHSSGYALRAVAINNTAVAMGLGGGMSRGWLWLGLGLAVGYLAQQEMKPTSEGGTGSPWEVLSGFFYLADTVSDCACFQARPLLAVSYDGNHLLVGAAFGVRPHQRAGGRHPR